MMSYPFRRSVTLSQDSSFHSAVAGSSGPIRVPMTRFPEALSSSSSSAFRDDELDAFKGSIHRHGFASCPDPHCRLSFLSLAGIVAHKKNCSGFLRQGEFVTCSICEARFCQFQSLRIHQEKSHGPQQQQPQEEPKESIPLLAIDNDVETMYSKEELNARLHAESRLISNPRPRGRPFKHSAEVCRETNEGFRELDYSYYLRHSSRYTVLDSEGETPPHRRLSSPRVMRVRGEDGGIRLVKQPMEHHQLTHKEEESSWSSASSASGSARSARKTYKRTPSASAGGSSSSRAVLPPGSPHLHVVGRAPLVGAVEEEEELRDVYHPEETDEEIKVEEDPIGGERPCGSRASSKSSGLDEQRAILEAYEEIVLRSEALAEDAKRKIKEKNELLKKEKDLKSWEENLRQREAKAQQTINEALISLGSDSLDEKEDIPVGNSTPRSSTTVIDLCEEGDPRDTNECYILPDSTRSVRSLGSSASSSSINEDNLSDSAASLSHHTKEQHFSSPEPPNISSADDIPKSGVSNTTPRLLSKKNIGRSKRLKKGVRKNSSLQRQLRQFLSSIDPSSIRPIRAAPAEDGIKVIKPVQRVPRQAEPSNIKSTPSGVKYIVPARSPLNGGAASDSEQHFEGRVDKSRNDLISELISATTSPPGAAPLRKNPSSGEVISSDLPNCCSSSKHNNNEDSSIAADVENYSQEEEEEGNTMNMKPPLKKVIIEPTTSLIVDLNDYLISVKEHSKEEIIDSELELKPVENIYIEEHFEVTEETGEEGATIIYANTEEPPINNGANEEAPQPLSCEGSIAEETNDNCETEEENINEDVNETEEENINEDINETEEEKTNEDVNETEEEKTNEDVNETEEEKPNEDVNETSPVRPRRGRKRKAQVSPSPAASPVGSPVLRRSGRRVTPRSTYECTSPLEQFSSSTPRRPSSKKETPKKKNNEPKRARRMSSREQTEEEEENILQSSSPIRMTRISIKSRTQNEEESPNEPRRGRKASMLELQETEEDSPSTVKSVPEPRRGRKASILDQQETEEDSPSMKSVPESRRGRKASILDQQPTEEDSPSMKSVPAPRRGRKASILNQQQTEEDSPSMKSVPAPRRGRKTSILVQTKETLSPEPKRGRRKSRVQQTEEDSPCPVSEPRRGRKVSRRARKMSTEEESPSHKKKDVSSPERTPSPKKREVSSSKGVTPSPKKRHRRFACGKCESAYSDRRQFAVHVASSHGGLARLAGESQEFSEEERDEALKQAFKLTKKVTCYKCGQSSFTTRPGLLYHMQRCGKTKNELFAETVPCPHCRYRGLPSGLKIHMKSHAAAEEPETLPPATPKEDSVVVSSGGRHRRSAAAKASKLLNETLSEFYNNEDEGGNEGSEDEEFSVTDEVDVRGKFKRLKGKKNLFACRVCSAEESSRKAIIAHILASHPEEEDEEEEYKEDDEFFEEEEDDEKVSFEETPIHRRSLKHHRITHGLGKCGALSPCMEHLVKELEFRQANFTPPGETLFGKILSNDFCRVLSAAESEPYLPDSRESLTFTQRTSLEKNCGGESVSLRRFEGRLLGGDTPMFFAGGPIWSLEWVPGEGESFFALSAHHSMNDVSHMFSLDFGLGVIQIWSGGNLLRSASSAAPVFKYGLLHDYGKIWCLKWCPSGTDSETHLGLLAAACSNGNIYIHRMRRPDAEDAQGSFYEHAPEMSLRPLRESFGQCLKLAWYNGRGHRVLGASYSAGKVALYDLLTDSSLLKRGSVLYPYRVLHAHTSAVNGLDLHGSSPGGFPRYLASGSFDRHFSVWDLGDPSAVPLVTGKKGLITDVHFFRSFPDGFVSLSHDDVYLQSHTQTILSEPGYSRLRTQPVLCHNSAIKNEAASFWLGTLAVGTSAGEVIVFVSPSNSASMDTDKYTTRRRTLIYRTELSHKDPGSNSQDYGECRDNLQDLQFVDMNLEAFQKNPESEINATRSADRLSLEDITRYPLAAVNRLSFNPNLRACSWLLSGCQNGLGRLHNIRALRHAHFPQFLDTYAQKFENP